jgi:hypothetical protein
MNDDEPQRPVRQLVVEWAIGLAFIALVLVWATSTGHDLDHEQRVKDTRTVPTFVDTADPGNLP